MSGNEKSKRWRDNADENIGYLRMNQAAAWYFYVMALLLLTRLMQEGQKMAEQTHKLAFYDVVQSLLKVKGFRMVLSC